MPHVEFFLTIAAIAAAAGLMILACHRPLQQALGELLVVSTRACLSIRQAQNTYSAVDDRRSS
jgi:hypothetical protein